MKAQWAIVCGLIFALITAIAAVINTENVMIDYYWGVIDVPLIVVISASISIGGVFVALFGTIRPYLLRKEMDKLRQKNQENQNLQEKLNELKSAYSLLVKQTSQGLDPNLNATIDSQNRTDGEYLVVSRAE